MKRRKHSAVRGAKWPDSTKNLCDHEPVAYAALLSRGFLKKWMLLQSIH
jgi:hypothetical protein